MSMRGLMTRYGGAGFIVGQGRASNDKLPEKQDEPDLWDGYATKLIPEVQFVSSYDARPNWMGAYEGIGRQLNLLCTIDHRAYEIFDQHGPAEALTKVYVIAPRKKNIWYVFAKSYFWNEDLYGSEEPPYDLVLAVFRRDKQHRNPKTYGLSDRPDLLKTILLIFLYKMECNAEDAFTSLTPAKTKLGRAIPQEFIDSLPELLPTLKNDKDLVEPLKSYVAETPSVIQAMAKSVSLTAFWANEDASSSIRIKKSDWDLICAGASYQKSARSEYEGARKDVHWEFSKGKFSVFESDIQRVVEEPVQALTLEYFY